MFAPNKVSLILMSALLPITQAFASNPESFIYSGSLSDLNGGASSGNVSIRLQIYNPAGDCLLYDEMQTVDLTASSGKFNLTVGSSLGDAKRGASDPGLAMTTIFSNPAAALRASGSTNCSSGYTPSSADTRRLRVTVIDGAGSDVLSPDQVIASVPFAMTATSLQGKQPGDFLQPNTTAGYSLNQTNLNQVFESTRFARLLSLLNGSTAFDMANQRLTSVASPTAATDAANKSYVDSTLAGSTVSGVPADGQVLTYNTALSQWQSVDLANHARVPASTCAANQASRWDGSAWSCIAVGGGGGAGGAGTLTVSNNIVNLTIASEKVQMISASTAGGVRLPDATGYTQTGGPIFQFLNSSSLYLPVLDFDGNFVGQIPANGGADVFLMNFSTAAGHWMMNSSPPMGSIPLRIETLTSEFGQSSSYTAITASNFAQMYVANNTPPYDLKLRGFSTNFSTMTSTLGSPVTLETGLSVPYLSGQRLVSLGAGKGLAVVENSGVKTAYPFTQSGTTVTPGASTTLSCSNIYGSYLIAGQDSFFCTNGSDVLKYDSTGNLVNSVTGFPNLGFVSKIGGYDLVGVCDGNSPSQLVLTAIDFADATPANRIKSTLTVTSANYCNMYGADDYGQKSPVVVVDTNNVWVLYENPSKKVKINWTGSALTIATAATPVGTSNAVSLSVGGQSYVTAGSGTATKNKITDLNTMTLGAAEASSECYGYRPTIGSCMSVDLQNTNLTIQHKVGF